MGCIRALDFFTLSVKRISLLNCVAAKIDHFLLLPSTEFVKVFYLDIIIFWRQCSSLHHHRGQSRLRQLCIV